MGQNENGKERELRERESKGKPGASAYPFTLPGLPNSRGCLENRGTQPQLCSLEGTGSRSLTLPSLRDPVPPPPARVGHSLIDRCTRVHRDLGQQAGEKRATSSLLAHLPDPHPNSKSGQMCA